MSADVVNGEVMPAGEDLARAWDERKALPAVVSRAGTLTTGGEFLTPAEFKQQLDDEAEKRRMLADWIRDQLIPGEDYGIVHRKVRGGDCPHKREPVMRGKDGCLVSCPTCGAKHTMRKGGGEKVLSFFKCVPRFDVDEKTLAVLEKCKITGWIPYICHATHILTGCVMSEGRGAAQIGEDPNKAMKMAKKSAMIDTALGFGLSSVFTQDIEKPSDYGDAGVPTKATTSQAPEPSAAWARIKQGDTVVGHVSEIKPKEEWTKAERGQRKWFQLREFPGIYFWTVSNPDSAVASKRWDVGAYVSTEACQDEQSLLCTWRSGANGAPCDGGEYYHVGVQKVRPQEEPVSADNPATPEASAPAPLGAQSGVGPRPAADGAGAPPTKASPAKGKARVAPDGPARASAATTGAVGDSLPSSPPDAGGAVLPALTHAELLAQAERLLANICDLGLNEVADVPASYGPTPGAVARTLLRKHVGEDTETKAPFPLELATDAQLASFVADAVDLLTQATGI